MLQQRLAFPAHIESIETVVPSVKIAGGEKERLEGSPHRFARGGNRLHDHDPGSETMPVPASQHHRLVTLDVDFHEMDLAIGDVLLAQRSQRSGLGLEGSRCEPVTACLDQHCVVAARDARAGCFVEANRPEGAGNGKIEVQVARPAPLQQREIRAARFDIDSAPAQPVKVTSNGMAIRVPRADVDIEAALDRFERPGKHHVFEVLRVTNHSCSLQTGLRAKTSTTIRQAFLALPASESAKSPRQAPVEPEVPSPSRNLPGTRASTPGLRRSNRQKAPDPRTYRGRKEPNCAIRGRGSRSRGGPRSDTAR